MNYELNNSMKTHYELILRSFLQNIRYRSNILAQESVPAVLKLSHEP